MAVNSSKGRCRRCLTALEGASELCIGCYRDLTMACSACMIRRGRHGEAIVERKNGQPVDCEVCGNERYVLRDYEPGEAFRGGQ